MKLFSDCFTSSAKAVYIASVLAQLEKPSLHIIYAADKKNAYFISSDLFSLFPEDKVFYLPSSGERSELRNATAKVQRTSAISAIISASGVEKPSEEALSCGTYDITKLTESDICRTAKGVIVVTYPDAMAEKVLRTGKTLESILTFHKGDRLTHDFVKELLFAHGFKKADFASEPGEFAIRGGIIDIFSFSDNYPYRIDFFGDEVDSIRRFDPNTQLSITELESVGIFPDMTVDNGSSDYVDFERIIPEGAQIWDLRQQPTDNSSTRVVPQPAFNKNFEILSKDIFEKQAEGYRVTILSPNDAQILRLEQILRDVGDGVHPSFMKLSIHEGYIDREEKICYYTDHQIFERYHKIRMRRQVERSERMTINELSALQVGDYVVHIDHGVGRYGGLVKTNVGGRIQEAVKIEYRDNAVIFVSIHGIHRISRYKSRDGEPPRIYKLGSKAWENLKATTKSKVKDIARDLIRLYSERQQLRGFAFSPDSYLQQELESSFLYEDTPDQQKATAAIKSDMESIHPMDRLVCGDVGFGKTELAIRAAFKAACDGKQVAVLVPTTILALQHFRTFSQRLKDFPVSIDYVSRLRSAKEIKETQESLAAGKTDIIIGTHRLLGKGVKFKDLGLLIIDEEQKFGVSSKEKLRQLKTSVDTLTLTATPIPRTLQFSLLGARDLSIINTPPPNRLPVYTEVIRFNDDEIADIINHEMERGGQVFFVHNKVEDILSVRDILHRIVPEADICVAHGQMDPETLEKKIVDFMNGNYDILLSTTIMENGIDIPNANTIIINQAQRFGLSDLHQMRGRVGRSNVKAYCYLIVPSMDSITDDARRRLRAIEAFSDLGSGFNIAMQDLDIRGAGDLLGAEQSGFISEMGFETYMRILNEAMSELPELVSSREGESSPEAASLAGRFIINTIDTQVETDMELLIPDSYVNVPSEKIRLYRELDRLKDEADLQRFSAEMIDRFGPIPEQFEQLINVVRLRRQAEQIGIERVVLKKNIMLAYFINNRMSPFYQGEIFAKVLANLQKYGRRYTLIEHSGKLYIKTEGVTTIGKAVQLLNNLFE